MVDAWTYEDRICLRCSKITSHLVTPGDLVNFSPHFQSTEYQLICNSCGSITREVRPAFDFISTRTERGM